MIFSSVLLLISAIWGVIGGISRVEFILQKLNLHETVIRYLVSPEGRFVLLVIALVGLVAVLIYQITKADLAVQPEAQEVAPKPRKELNSPKTNIVFLKDHFKMPFLRLYKSKFQFLSPNFRNRQLWGVLASFENVPNPPFRIESAGRVRAQISYYLKSNLEYARINNGCWVGGDVFNPEFSINKTNHLVIGTFPCDEKPSSSGVSVYEFSEELQMPVIKKGVQFGKVINPIVKVRLIPEAHNELTQEFVFDLTITGKENEFFVNLIPR